MFYQNYLLFRFFSPRLSMMNKKVFDSLMKIINTGFYVLKFERG